MNAWDFISYFRGLLNAAGMRNLTVPEILHFINLGYDYVANGLYPLFGNELIIEYAAGEYDSLDTLFMPDDAKEIVDVFRETAHSSGVYNLCTKVPVENKNFIGEHPDYPNRSDYPYLVEEGRKLLVYPAFPASPDGVNIKIVYKRRLAHLVYGSSTTTGAADTLVLDDFADITNDVYNLHRMAIFAKASTAWRLNKILKVADYVGSTKVCSFVGTAGSDEFSAATTYRYALFPFTPIECDSLIIEATKMQLALAGHLQGDPGVTEKGIQGRMAQMLSQGGFNGK